MKFRPWLVMLLVGLVGLASAAAPVIVVPADNVDEGEAIQVSLDGKVEDVAWKVTRADGTAPILNKLADGSVIFGTGKKKQAITILAAAAYKDGDKVRAALLEKVLNKDAPKPSPTPPTPVPPNPQPGPTPDPIPVGKVARFVVVEDVNKAGQFRGDVLGSAKVQAFYKASNLRHLVISTGAQGPNGVMPEPQKSYLAMAQSKELPYIFGYDAAGKEVLNQPAPRDPDKFVQLLGDSDAPRKMGNVEPTKLKYSWKVFGEHPNVPIIPRQEWKEVDLSAFLPPVYDQDGRGQCNASATCTAAEACRKQAGLPYVKLSAGDLYSQINDGRDQGSMLEDGVAAMSDNGVCTAATVPYVWDGKNWSSNAKVKAERAQHKVVEAYLCPNFDAMCSALQQGFFIVEGLMWYDNFRPDQEGWLPSRGAGGGGGHALAGYGVAKRTLSNGTVQWGIRTRNSWSASWGQGGNCVIPESLFNRTVGGFWAVRSVTQTQTDFPMPTVAVTPKVGVVPPRIEDKVLAPSLKP